MHANYLEDKTASQTCYCVVGPDRTQIANVLQQCVRPRFRASHDGERIIEDPHPKSDAEKLVNHISVLHLWGLLHCERARRWRRRPRM